MSNKDFILIFMFYNLAKRLLSFKNIKICVYLARSAKKIKPIIRLKVVIIFARSNSL